LGRGALCRSTHDELGKSPESDQIIAFQDPGLDPDTVQEGPVAAVEVFDGDGIGTSEDPRVMSRDLRVIYTELTGTIPADDDGLIFLEPLDPATAGPMEDVHLVGIHGERLASWLVRTRTAPQATAKHPVKPGKKDPAAPGEWACPAPELRKICTSRRRWKSGGDDHRLMKGLERFSGPMVEQGRTP
jgi:hypothetical protein